MTGPTGRQTLTTLLWLCICCWLGQAAATEPATRDGGEAKRWLERMLQASRMLSYEGEFVYLQQYNPVEVMRVLRSGDSGRQRMVSLLGPEHEVVVEDHSVVSMLPKQRASFTASQNRTLFPISFPHDLDALQSNYRFRLDGESRVAARRVQIIAVEPRDRLRFGYRLWLDVDNGMVLRSALVDTRGAFLEQMIFTDISFLENVEPERLQPRFATGPVSRGVAQTGSQSQAAGESAWRLSVLPVGFRQILSQRFAADAAGDEPIEHRVLSDGLATVSIFIEYLGGRRSPLLQGVSAMGPMNAFGRLQDGYQLLVIGEVPARTVALIAGGLERAPGGPN